MKKDEIYWYDILDKFGIKQSVILRTCNRVEIYYIQEATAVEFEIPNYKEYSGDEAIKHLFSVASGLESMSVGEQEILRQLKEAYEESIKIGRN
ncbi:glutamyl-tRNA reductase, partial [mine drainage metagenome]